MTLSKTPDFSEIALFVLLLYMSIQRDTAACQLPARIRIFNLRELAMLKSLSILPLTFAAVFATATAMVSPAVSEETVANPLRPKTSESRRAKPAEEAKRPEAAKPETEAAKPKRERSASQKQNDDMMRACGQEWRAEKAALQAKGETWRGFLKECRAKKKAEIKA
jgi:hypothetical protein